MNEGFDNIISSDKANIAAKILHYFTTLFMKLFDWFGSIKTNEIGFKGMLKRIAQPFLVLILLMFLVPLAALWTIYFLTYFITYHIVNFFYRTYHYLWFGKAKDWGITYID